MMSGSVFDIMVMMTMHAHIQRFLGSDLNIQLTLFSINIPANLCSYRWRSVFR